MDQSPTDVLPRCKQLTPRDHNQLLAGFRYIYPVVSRRAGGVSVGVDLNPNHACNWRCVYCQVTDLQRGAPEPLDIAQLEHELAAMLQEILHGGFMAEHVPAAMRRLSDIAIAGNGEPTLSRQFPQAIDAVIRQAERFGLIGKIRIVVISNGSMLHRAAVQQALRRLADAGGEIWVKVDRAGAQAVRQVNQVAQTPERVRQQVARAVACCPTRIQTCMFKWDGQLPAEPDLAAYLELLASLDGIAGVLLYGVARRPMLPEGCRVTPAEPAWMEALAGRIRGLGLPADVFI